MPDLRFPLKTDDARAILDGPCTEAAAWLLAHGDPLEMDEETFEAIGRVEDVLGVTGDDANDADHRLLALAPSLKRQILDASNAHFDYQCDLRTLSFLVGVAVGRMSVNSIDLNGEDR